MNNIDSKTFNKNWMVRLDYDEIHCLIGYYKMKDFLDDKFEKVMKRVSSDKTQKCVIKPFHHCTMTFYCR